MLDKNIISVIVPTYNRAQLIGKTLQTLADQSTKNFEVIIIDDGSSDNTEEVVKPFLSDNRFSYSRIKNSERGAARNAGARAARGMYVNFFDSDDLAFPNHIQAAHDAIEKLNNPEVIHLAYDILHPDGQRRVVNNFKPIVNDSLINGNHLSCNGVFLRKDIASAYPFSEDRQLSASEDYELWLRLAARFPIHSINTVTSTVVNHDARSVLTIQYERFLKRMSILRINLEADAEVQKQFGVNWSEFIAYQNIYIGLHLAMAKAGFIKSVAYLFKALRAKPGVLFSRRFLAALKVTFLNIK